MAGAICPVVDGTMTRRPLHLGVHAIACTASGGLVFSGLGWMGQGLPGAGAAIVAVLAIGAAVVSVGRGLNMVTWRPVGLRRQVRRRWTRQHFSLVTSAMWGVELGVGFTTRVQSWSYWSLVALALLTDPLIGFGAGAAFGLTRGLEPSLVRGEREAVARLMTALRQTYDAYRFESLGGAMALCCLALVIALPQ